MKKNLPSTKRQDTLLLVLLSLGVVLVATLAFIAANGNFGQSLVFLLLAILGFGGLLWLMNQLVNGALFIAKWKDARKQDNNSSLSSYEAIARSLDNHTSTPSVLHWLVLILEENPSEDQLNLVLAIVKKQRYLSPRLLLEISQDTTTHTDLRKRLEELINSTRDKHKKKNLGFSQVINQIYQAGLNSLETGDTALIIEIQEQQSWRFGIISPERGIKNDLRRAGLEVKDITSVPCPT